MNAIIEISNLVKQYENNNVNAVDGINLNIQQKSIFGLLGPNGAGKTTTISMLCGLVKPTTGKILVAGNSIETKTDKVKQIIGVVPQEIALYPSLTAKENLTFFGTLYNLNNKTLTERINLWLDKFGLLDKANYKISTFSGGMKRRINLIAGLLHNPQIIFLDEPTVGIDVQSRNVIVEQLKELNNKKGITIVYTSHHMDEAEYLCSEIAIIDNGKIITQGTPTQLLNKNVDCNRLEDVFLKLTGKSLRD